MTLQTRWRSVTVGCPCVFGAAGLAGASAFSLCSSPRPRDVGFLRRGTHYSKLPAAPRDGGTHGPTGIQPHAAAEPPAPSPQPGPLRAWEHGVPRCCCACCCPGAPPSWWLPGVKQVLLTLPNWLPGGGGLFSI